MTVQFDPHSEFSLPNQTNPSPSDVYEYRIRYRDTRWDEEAEWKVHKLRNYPYHDRIYTSVTQVVNAVRQLRAGNRLIQVQRRPAASWTEIDGVV